MISLPTCNGGNLQSKNQLLHCQLKNKKHKLPEWLVAKMGSLQWWLFSWRLHSRGSSSKSSTTVLCVLNVRISRMASGEGTAVLCNCSPKADHSAMLRNWPVGVSHLTVLLPVRGRTSVSMWSHVVGWHKLSSCAFSQDLFLVHQIHNNEASSRVPWILLQQDLTVAKFHEKYRKPCGTWKQNIDTSAALHSQLPSEVLVKCSVSKSPFESLSLAMVWPNNVPESCGTHCWWSR